jgi:hypothetical protein
MRIHPETHLMFAAVALATRVSPCVDTRRLNGLGVIAPGGDRHLHALARRPMR